MCNTQLPVSRNSAIHPVVPGRKVALIVLSAPGPLAELEERVEKELVLCEVLPTHPRLGLREVKVTERLGVAFSTTLLALVMASILVFIQNVVQGKEENALNKAGQYCLDNLINRLYSP